ncbi:MAG TPA: hypothetical protein VLE73_04415 [Candidatus Saccharimonadales bacterium]|nr:hypothetical protein [Candidatus Saccharimonadales bacterium]
MKQVLVIGGVSTDPADVDEITAFTAGVHSHAGDAAVQFAHLDQLQFVFAPGDFRVFDANNNCPLSDYNLVILRSKMRTYATLAYCLSRYLTNAGIPFFNDYSTYFTGTKLGQTVLFYEQRVPFLKTVYSLHPDLLVAAAEQELGLPFILKDSRGAQGKANYLVHSLDEARSILASGPDMQFLAQEYCPTDRDYRVLIAGGANMVFSRQGNLDTHLHNTSQGASARVATDELPESVIADARKLARRLGLSTAGIDVIPGSREHGAAFYFLEINSQPQIFTGTLLPEKAALFERFIARHLGQ